MTEASIQLQRLADYYVVRDQGEELCRLLYLTPFAREEFELSYIPATDPVEQARRTLDPPGLQKPIPGAKVRPVWTDTAKRDTAMTTEEFRRLRAQGGNNAVLRALNPEGRRSRLEQLMDEEEASQGEATLFFHLKHSALPPFVTEFEFALEQGRKWRFDVAWPGLMVAAEVDGVMWGVQGRHQRPDHLEDQNDKQNAATSLGWRVYRFTTAQVLSGKALETLEWAFRQLGQRGGKP